MGHIGVAAGNRLTGTASPLRCLLARDGVPDHGALDALIAEWGPEELVVGLPLNMDGTEQPLTAHARRFARRLGERYGLRVSMVDERLTTVEAKGEIFSEGGFRALKKDKGRIDSRAATIILEDFLAGS
ncbi:MAG: Holliday junction resolvase RuvX [Succinivibrionaceae bacterium]|nr:Holliday junction resolvase RuvX [Succinivibrionaceae bacterium]